MEPAIRFRHASSQAPWRVERQWISVFLLIVLGFAMIATLYLMVTSQAAIVGREIQDLHAEVVKIEQENADLESEIARLTSKDEIERRAYQLSFRPITPEDLEYLFIPGYVIQSGVTMASTPELQPGYPSTPPEYTQSLLEWLDIQLQPQSRGMR